MNSNVIVGKGVRSQYEKLTEPMADIYFAGVERGCSWFCDIGARLLSERLHMRENLCVVRQFGGPVVIKFRPNDCLHQQ